MSDFTEFAANQRGLAANQFEKIRVSWNRLVRKADNSTKERRKSLHLVAKITEKEEYLISEIEKKFRNGLKGYQGKEALKKYCRLNGISVSKAQKLLHEKGITPDLILFSRALMDMFVEKCQRSGMSGEEIFEDLANRIENEIIP